MALIIISNNSLAKGINFCFQKYLLKGELLPLCAQLFDLKI